MSVQNPPRKTAKTRVVAPKKAPAKAPESALARPEFAAEPARQATRIQRQNSQRILDAALDVFSAQGYRGSTLDQIADLAGLSKPNVLYYFASKEVIYHCLLTRLLEDWLDPLRALDPEGEPIAEVMGYMRRKLQLSRDFPRESRLFANEILQGAPRILEVLQIDLAQLVRSKAGILSTWMEQGRIAKMDPLHLVFSIWALTQHYADFDVQVRAVLGAGRDPMQEADQFLTQFYTKLLTP